MVAIVLITLIVCAAGVYVFYIYMCYLREKESKQEQRTQQEAFNKMPRAARRKLIFKQLRNARN